MVNKHQVKLGAFFADHPVFTLDEVASFAAQRLSPAAVTARLSYATRTGRIRSISRGIYVVTPPGRSALTTHIDPFLVALAARPDAIFSHHSALELLGAAHSAWSTCTLYCSGARMEWEFDGSSIRAVPHPTALARCAMTELGTRRVERRGSIVRTTGPERTLIEGFRQPSLVGGVSELVASAAGFATLDIDLLAKLLELYAIRRLWAAVGWFLEVNAQSFAVSEADLLRFEQHRPNAPQYLVRATRGGNFIARWNLVLPQEIGKGDPDVGES